MFDLGDLTYWQHWRMNMKVVGKALALAIFHFLHAWIPIKLTDHHYWGISLSRPPEK